MPERPLHTTLGTPFIELQSVDSTNNYALTLVHAGLAQPGTAVFAHQQTAGKGQRGNTWASEKGNSLSLSLIIEPSPLTTAYQFRLSACVAVAVCRAVSGYAGDEVRIKWPNDIYWQDRKAGGILIESVVAMSASGTPVWKWAVCGIGLNVNQVRFPDELTKAVSLRQITGRNFIPSVLAKEICGEIEAGLTAMAENGFEHTFSDFNNLLYKRGENVRLKMDNRNFEGTVKGVSETGELIIHHGIDQHYKVGEVRIVV